MNEIKKNTNEEYPEIGDKTLPIGYASTAIAAIQFTGKGISTLRSLPKFQTDPKSGEKYFPLPEDELIGRLCIGNLLIAQGLELLLKLIFITEELDEKKLKQHAISEKFSRIKSLEPLKSNIEKYMPKKDGISAIQIAKEVVQKAEEAFMVSRYMGLRKENLSSINELDAAGLLLAITFSYKGMYQIQAARLIGLDIKKKDGSPMFPQKTKVLLKINPKKSKS